MNTTLAVAQFAPDADRDRNLAEIGRLAKQARKDEADVVLFPEYASYFVDPMDESVAANAEPIGGPFVRKLTELAGELQLVIVAGLLESTSSHLVHNTVVAVGESGVLASYRKVHLYDAFGRQESSWVLAGDAGQEASFEAHGIGFGLLTCYDLRFPELARRRVDEGADVLLVPAAWVPGRAKEEHWLTLCAARAIENTAYLAAADHPPPLGIGHSMILDPEGTRLSGVVSETGIAAARLTSARIQQVRLENPALKLRRYAVVPSAT